MGFNSLATFVILFSIGMSMIVGFLLVYKDYFVRSSVSLDSRQEISRQKLNSDIEIQSAGLGSEVGPYEIIIENQSQFEEGIFDNTTATENSGYLRIDQENLSGSWYSDIYEFNQTLNFSKIEISGSVTVPQENISIKIRTAKTIQKLTGDFIGPDGTTNTNYTIGSSQDIYQSHDGDKVIQIKAILERESDIREPQIDKINITYKITDVINLTIKNSGKIRLDKEIMDYFIDGERINRTQVISSEVDETTDILNPKLWDPEENLNVLISKNISSGSHIMSAVNEHSQKDYETLTT